MKRVEIALMSGLGKLGDKEEAIIRFNNGRRFFLKSNGHLEEWKGKEIGGEWEKVEAESK